VRCPLKNLILNRPLAVIDLETTGTNTQRDRIVEISVLKIFPDGTKQHRTRRVNPGIQIPAAATAIHGITDTDVANEPPFKQIAIGLGDFLEGCDLCGYHFKNFDLPLLIAEFTRVGVPFSLSGRSIVDPLEIFFEYEPRDLSAAARFYLSEKHDNAHSAAADADVTIRVLDAMLTRYPDLPRTVAELDKRFRDPNAVDLAGKFTRVEDQIRFTFGRYAGEQLDEVVRKDPEYLNWILTADFAEDTKDVVRKAMANA
jgi:DNA polymerase-3 subunit epsilon